MQTLYKYVYVENGIRFAVTLLDTRFGPKYEFLVIRKSGREITRHGDYPEPQTQVEMAAFCAVMVAEYIREEMGGVIG